VPSRASRTSAPGRSLPAQQPEAE